MSMRDRRIDLFHDILPFLIIAEMSVLLLRQFHITPALKARQLARPRRRDLVKVREVADTAVVGDDETL